MAYEFYQPLVWATQAKLAAHSPAYGFDAIFQRNLIIEHAKDVSRLQIYQPRAIETAEHRTKKS
jgi:hypothetical protein